ncbi:thioredoxin domain-containing protein [Halomarina ordinaria]|uniref:Thioredoxin domain-containing protein n=1 Tax=Halomarina ordinaria TaxID=3033939 RepID=A0ABD5UBQ1_9EURY|nr:thioredoxin domain-containing protein [Halomarina sp. PSRA2]
MTDAAGRNRLDEEESPYLRQHADNPVDWQPWDEDALAEARERDVPIFLSIGYSACHWCHVMAEESFEDEAVAEVLNEEFVPIKVDREERPDLDSLYINICQMVRGNAGWPLSAWLTPEGKPFFVGTYFPPEPKRGMPGFRDLLTDIAGSWNDPEDREEMRTRAEQWTRAIEDELESVPDGPGDAPDEGLLERAAEAAVRGADREHGGFGRGQKFPHPGRVHVLLRAADRTGREVYRDVASETLAAMANRGLYDHVGGGFHRYTTDRSWTVPHFEKMLYDQAELVRAMLAGFQATGTARYRHVASETLGFVERELTHDEGGFFSTLDARSGGEEGTFYVWTPEAVHDAVDDETAADLFCAYYGVTESGNFEEGTTVLTVSATVDDLAERFDLPEAAVRENLEAAEDAVADARGERERPPRDEKVLAGWNGLMISAFAEGALVCEDRSAEAATDALAFVREHLWDEEDGTLTRRYKDGDAAIAGYLEDYAFLGRGALNCYEATGEVEHLAFARDLARATVREFWDEERGTLYFTPASGESLVARPQELTDQSTPSSAGVAASLLLALDGFFPEEGFEAVAEGVLETHGGRLESDPLQHASLALAADEYTAGHVELTVAADGWPPAWRDRLATTYLPRRLLAPRPPTPDGLDGWLDALGLASAPPLWASRDAENGAPTAYLCEGFACSPPRTNIENALAWRER